MALNAAIAEEVSASSEQIAASSEQMSATTEEIASAAQILNDTAGEVMEEVNKFKL